MSSYKFDTPRQAISKAPDTSGAQVKSNRGSIGNFQGPIAPIREHPNVLLERDFTPIKIIDTHLPSWIICARLVKKYRASEFSFYAKCVFQDNSSEIGMIFLSRDIFKYFNQLVEGQLYTISNAIVNKVS